MKHLIALLMLSPLLIFFLLQPSLNHAEEIRGKQAQVVINTANDKASIEGRYTDGIIQYIKDEMKKVGYKEEEIELEVTTSLTHRGEYVEGRIQVPNKYYMLLSKALLGWEFEDLYHIRSSSRMSEYVD